MSHQWYVVHTYSGYEKKVKDALWERIKAMGKEKYFSEIIVPTEKVTEIVKGKRRNTEKRIFPGYILIKMELNDETWHVVKGTPNVTSFAGGGRRPLPISDEEVDKIMKQVKEGVKSYKSKILFNVGDNVRVTEGPFSNFIGTIEEVRPEKGKVKVLISIFGRSTPVELDFNQVERN